jgi:Ca2+-binding EF-hand superfamily protein
VQFLATFNNNFSLQEVEAFINDESCQPNGVLDFPEFVNTVSRLIAASLDTPVCAGPDLGDTC